MTDDFAAQPYDMLARLGPGSRIAGYLIEERIGAGGMAVVFRARDEVLGRVAAMKVLAPALAADEEFRVRFLRESRAVATVDEPHIIPVYAAGETEGVLYIATRFVAGGDLGALVRQTGPLAPDRVVSLVAQVASALDAAHAAGLVHRDVKPGNILVDAVSGRPEHAYLSDFGLSKGTITSTGLTSTGQFLGTPEYCAPEQIRGKPLDGRADLYALACVAYTLLSGTLPFHRPDMVATLFAHLNDPAPTLTALRPDLPVTVDRVLERALAKEPRDRFASCGEFAAALRAAFDSPKTRVPVDKTRHRRKTALIAGAAAILIAAGVVTALELPGSGGSQALRLGTPTLAARFTPPHGGYFGWAWLSPDGKLLAVEGAGSYSQDIFLWDTATHKYLTTLTFPAGQSARVVFSLTGTTLTGISSSGSNTLNVWRWNLSTGKRTLVLSLPGQLNVTLSRDGNMLAIEDSTSDRADLWDLTTGARIAQITAPGSMRGTGALSLDNDGGILAIASGGKISVWDTSTRKVIAVLPLAFGVLSPDGKTILSYGGSGQATLWDVATRANITPDDSRWPQNFTGFAFSANGQIYASNSNGRRGEAVDLWDIARHTHLATVDSADHGQGDVYALDQGGHELITGEVHTNPTEQLYLWDIP